MPSPDIKRRLSSFGLFLLPLITVKLASAVMGGAAPVHATAMPAPAIEPAAAGEAPGTPTSARIEWSADQRAAAEHVRQLAAMPFGPAPMLYTAAPEAPKPVVRSAPVVEKPRDPEVPQFTLHAVMAAPAGDKALINGRLYMIGQTVLDTGWVVREINTAKRSVTLAEFKGTRSVTVPVSTQRSN